MFALMEELYWYFPWNLHDTFLSKYSKHVTNSISLIVTTPEQAASCLTSRKGRRDVKSSGAAPRGDEGTWLLNSCECAGRGREASESVVFSFRKQRALSLSSRI